MVNTTTIDACLYSTRIVAGLLVKIDAEGADLKVMAGMTEALSRKACVVQIELYPALVVSDIAYSAISRYMMTSLL